MECLSLLKAALLWARSDFDHGRIQDPFEQKIIRNVAGKSQSWRLKAGKIIELGHFLYVSIAIYV